jgi:DNA-binding transcriptional regulator YiaG
MTAAEYKKIRESLGDQVRVAELLGVTKNTVSRRETGESPVDREAELAIRCLAEHARRKSA